MNLNELLEKRGRLLENMREGIKGEGQMSVEDRAKFDGYKAEYNSISQAIKDLQFLEFEASAIESDNRGRIITTTPINGGEKPKTYAEAFEASLRAVRSGSPWELRDFGGNALNITTAGDGGYLAPDEYNAEIIKKANANNVMRQLCTIKQTSSGKYRTPVRTTRPAAGATGEGVTNTKGATYYDIVEIEPCKMTLEVPITDEMLNDGVFDMRGEITEAIAEGFNDLAEAWYVDGNGTSAATGILKTATVGKIAASATAITFDELQGLKFAVPKKYWPVSKYLMNQDTLLLCHLLKDGIQRPLLQQSVQDPTQYNIGGHTIEVSDSMPDAGSALKPVLFGDFKRYYIVDRQASFLVDPYSSSSDGIVLVKAFMRTGGKLTLAEAVQALQMSA